MSEEEIKVALESLRGQLRRLDTVLKMSVAEQRRINADLATGTQNLGAQCRGLDQRLDRLETRLAAYTGGLFTLWLLFQVAQSLWR